MSRYFAAAENCGLRTSGDETLRLARRTIASSTPEVVASQIAEQVKVEAERVARYKRHPETNLEVVPVEALPLADSRVEHSAKLQKAREELLAKELRDLDDFTQRKKIEAMQVEELRRLLAEEDARKRQLEADAQAEAARREEERERLVQQLTNAYGPCFLWDRDEKEKKSKVFNSSGLEKQLEKRIAEHHSYYADSA